MADNLSIASDIYSNVKYLGQGAFGRVFRGCRISDVKEIAIKEVNLDYIGNTRPNEEEKENYRVMAQREYDVMAAAKHPNVVEVFDFYSEGDFIHITMEYCDSDTLKQAIQARRPRLYPESLIWLWIGQLARALDYLHEVCNVLHRDVKADNIFLTCGGSFVKLGDFGVAKQLDRMGQSARTGWGTISHSAPELFEGSGFTAKSEFWCLGVVFHHIATLDLPYKGNEAAILFQVVSGKPPEISADHYSGDLRSFAHDKLLNKVPALRPSAADILQHPRIQAALDDLATQCSYVSPCSASLPCRYSTEMINTIRRCQFLSLGQTPHCLNYFQRFEKNPRDLFKKAPSPVFAVVVIPNERNKRSPWSFSTAPTLAIICNEGEIIVSPLITINSFSTPRFGFNQALSSRDWATVEWICKVKLPADQQIYLYHAVYDLVTDELYFVNGSGDTRPIFRASYSRLMLSSGSDIVELGILVDEDQVDGRRFSSLTIDSVNRLLYACDEYGSKHNDISIWLLTKLTTQLIGSIKTGYQPAFCSFHIKSLDSPIFYLAVSDCESTRIDLLTADWQSYIGELARGSSTGNGNAITVFEVGDVESLEGVVESSILRRVAFIAHENVADRSQLGSVSYPRELAFDAAGNLFVSQNREPNQRIQVFAFDENTAEHKSTMKAVWASNKIGWSCYRLALAACSPRQSGSTLKTPCLITHGSSGANSVAAFEYEQ